MQSLVLLSGHGKSPISEQPLTLGWADFSLLQMLSRNQPTLKYSNFQHNEVSVKVLPRKNNIMVFRATPGSMASMTQQVSQIVQGNRREFGNQAKLTHSLFGEVPWGFTWMSVSSCLHSKSSYPLSHLSMGIAYEDDYSMTSCHNSFHFDT